ncbi:MULTISPECIES: pyrroloquinoline quinone biosynthesis protein PqqF [unclassified Pseudomonas]|uniref:pyrroloquinoline quinone biosynthesis protein PqqF n=1 Tax=unclassified Pseudomonas TaxID=196821 RepID=UPI002097F180|nr:MULTISPECIES: pyrroloquinoline quinone biosynthesis protein PqqF [unclassified Pseudomonas]MCO7518872.1 pyrroloquinoline quinone biosynthesis protein PqqF [Pseudomonas sp. 1]MCO7539448.1 pyrroloquinoline quinone biosynthesis protein PqqF [Pseudomonas sp. VA159-2]
MSDAIRHLTLANGLHLTLRHAPRLKRAAAALRVHAGSHDAPPRWPGLAHFLEHLFFLGTERFPLDDGLMRYVQGLGGQVNASTRERTTDFFFEVPPAALAGGLERLCQMLVEPDFAIERQGREREVIHAEFIAWSRNPEAQQQFALLQSVAANHPLRAFHAGNRYSLPLRDAAFQRALQAFHRCFYQGSQITLSLAGPQPLEALEALARRLGAQFAAGTSAGRPAPPRLLDGPLRSPSTQDLLFAHEHLPAQAEQALELLLDLLSDSRPGGWLAELRQRGWLQDCKAQRLYSHAGQLLWHVRLQLTAQADAAQAQQLLYSWLGFVRQQAGPQLHVTFAQLQQRREQAASALELARRDSADQPYQGLARQGLAALDALLADLPQGPAGPWHLPPAEPLLTTTPAARHAPLPQGLTLSDALPASRQFATLYLRWQLPSAARVLQVLQRALQALRERAERAAVQLDLEASGGYLQLRIGGYPLAVVNAAAEALELIGTPAREHWQAPAAREPALIPIRALLKALPNALDPAAAQGQPAGELASPWRHARWQGLAIGFDQASRDALGAALQAIPGQPGEPPARRHFAGRHWHQVHTPGGEPALLLFCPLPAPLQACGRLLAHLLQGPVYQRLRVELQLGYAVFSAFRQIAGHGGLLFGVQSPQAGQREVLGHLTTLLQEGVQLAADSRQQLAEQFSEAAMANVEVAHWAWQAHMATQNPQLACMSEAILTVEQHDLDALLQQLLAAEHGWLCLANAPAPDAHWH